VSTRRNPCSHIDPGGRSVAFRAAVAAEPSRSTPVGATVGASAGTVLSYLQLTPVPVPFPATSRQPAPEPLLKVLLLTVIDGVVHELKLPKPQWWIPDAASLPDTVNVTGLLYQPNPFGALVLWTTTSYGFVVSILKFLVAVSVPAGVQPLMSLHQSPKIDE
jgi:hypothetical protein